jgi:tetrapyrrole methylase family protein / MazG family protein
VNEPQADPADLADLPEPPPGILDRALTLVEFLRANCPWDSRQTHASLRRYLLEESHEVVAAVDAGDDDALREELGDLLLNLAFQVVIAEERRAFDRDAVVRGLEEKMRRRHPHLYGSPEPVSWEALKALERGTAGAAEEGLLHDLVQGVDALAHAFRIQARVAGVGFDWADPVGAWAKVREEVEEVGSEVSAGDQLRLEEEIGDLLFAVVNAARLSHVEPTLALTRANQKFARRFARLEVLAREAGLDLRGAGLAALDRLWDEVKREEG